MFEKPNSTESENSLTTDNWDSVADEPFNKEQNEQNSSEKEIDTVSAAKKHRHIWDKIVDRYHENEKRHDEIESKLQALGLGFNDFDDNEDKLSDNLRSEFYKYQKEYDSLESLEHNYDRINDKMSERLANHVLDGMDGDKITELFKLDPRYEGYTYHDYEDDIKTVDDLLNDNEKFGIFCMANAKDPIDENLRGKKPKDVLQILENTKDYYEISKKGQKRNIASVLQRVSYNKEGNNRITAWLDENVPNHEAIESEALRDILNDKYNTESEEEIFTELFE